MYTGSTMSKTRKIILISLLNISIVLWLTLIYSVLTHKDDEALVNYKSKEEVKEKSKKTEPEKEIIQDNELPGF